MMKFAVNGASGFIGNHVVAQALEQGHEVVALVRRSSPPKDIELLKQLGAQVEKIDDKLDRQQLVEQLKQCDGLVHLIGSIAPKKGQNFEELHKGAANFYFQAAKEAQIKKIVMVTALGAGENAPSEYHRTKWLAEEELKRQNLPYVILRPSLIIGKILGHRDSKLVRRFIDLIQNKKRVPLVMGGTNLVQPLFVGDLASAVVKALVNPGIENQTLDLAGKEVVSTRQFVGILMNTLGLNKSFLSIPGPVAKFLAFWFEKFMEVPLVSFDQLKIAKMNGISREKVMENTFKIGPKSISESLSFYQLKAH